MNIPIINGKQYPLWSQFVDRKAEYIGKVLQDFGDPMDRAIAGSDAGLTTEITDITLTPNGKESAAFSVIGKDFTCAFDVQYGGVSEGASGWVTFAGYGGHAWRIQSN